MQHPYPVSYTHLLASEIGTTATGSVIGSLYLAKEFYPEQFKDIDLAKVHQEFQETLFNSELTGIYAYPTVKYGCNNL